MNLILRKTQTITVAREQEKWTGQFEQRPEKQLGFRSFKVFVHGKESGFSPYYSRTFEQFLIGQWHEVNFHFEKRTQIRVPCGE